MPNVKMLTNITELLFWKIAILDQQSNDENIQQYIKTKYSKI